MNRTSCAARPVTLIARLLSLSLAVSLAPNTMHAQAAGARAGAGAASKSSKGGCPAPDTTATWFKRQREWLDESSAKWSDESMRNLLLSTGQTAGGTSSALLGYELVQGPVAGPSKADSTVIAGLMKLASERGSTWPTKSVVGARGVLAVWALAAKDTVFARAALKRMMEAGPDESPPAAVAILEDRQRVRIGRKQLYGTQLQKSPTGAWAPLPIEDEAHLALRRDGAELPPLAQSLCAANSAKRP